MKSIVIALALLAPLAAHAASKPPTKLAVKPLTNAKRIKLAVAYATKQTGDRDHTIYAGWYMGKSKQPVVAKTGSVRVSIADAPSDQYLNYFVTFNKQTNKPNQLKIINSFE